MSVPVIWSPAYEVDIGAHVFPTRKYRLVRERLLAEGVVGEDAFVDPDPVDDQILGRIHTATYLRKIQEDDFSLGERLALEVPFSHEVADAMRLCCGGTLLAGRLAVRGRGAAVHLGGGFHHAFPDHGEGFCLLNDVAVAAAELLASGELGRIAVVDLDVHHGNGTAAALAGEERAFTFSMHQERNYPEVKPPSDLDVGLPDGIGDQGYLGLLEEHLPEVLEASRAELVLYLAGADPYREDQLGGLGLTLDGLRARDRMVFETSRRSGAAVAVLLAGGYARDTSDTVEIHVNTCREAARVVGS
jgi:acetoin utilization deacetylase AcuC-like enzyme